MSISVRNTRPDQQANWVMTGGERSLTSDGAPVVGGLMGVLSASTYTSTVQSVPETASHTQLFGGFVVANHEDESEGPPHPTKRRRINKSSSIDDGDGSDETRKPQRGRPRVNKSDETAIDRRRTQIRLAQRAYRNRKETTIASLQMKVQETEGTLDHMSQLFTSLYSNLVSVGVTDQHRHISQQLDRLRDEFRRVKGTESCGPDTARNEEMCQRPETSSSDNSANAGYPTNNNSSQTRTTASPESPTGTKRRFETYASQRNESNVGPTALNVHEVTWHQPLVTPHQERSSKDDMQRCASFSNALNRERAFPRRTSYTYSFQETSLSRRLHRFCLEQAFQKLSHPSINPAWVAHVFYFSMANLNKPRIQAMFKDILQRGAGEPLENEKLPYYQVGGAGTHYLRHDSSGNLIFPSNLQNPLLAGGPWRASKDIDSISPLVAQKAMESIGFGGQWFDPHDVEAYLATRGIRFDGRAPSFVEVDVSRFMSSNGSLATAGQDIAASQTGTSLLSSQSLAMHHDHDSNIACGSEIPVDRHNNALTHQDKDVLQDYNPMYDWSHQLPATKQAVFGVNDGVQMGHQSYRRVAMDVDELLVQMIEGAACLGRAPGFRRESVDKALAMVIQRVC